MKICSPKERHVSLRALFSFVIFSCGSTHGVIVEKLLLLFFKFYFFLFQEALIRKILSKPFKIPIPNYKGDIPDNYTIPSRLTIVKSLSPIEQILLL